MKVLKLLLISATIAGVSSFANAAVVGVDFYSSNDGWQYHENVTHQGGTFNLNQIATGVVPVVGSSWNAYLATQTGVSGSALLNDSGASTTISFIVASNYAYFYQAPPSKVDDGGFAGTPGDGKDLDRANLRILTTQLGTNSSSPVTLSLSGIQYASYDLIVYVGGTDASGRLGNAHLAAGSPIYFLTQSGADYQASPGFIQATATDQASAQTANYVRFSNLSGDSQSLLFDNLGANYGITGFQVVEAIPEPSTYALFGGIAAIGMGFVARYRRRK